MNDPVFFFSSSETHYTYIKIPEGLFNAPLPCNFPLVIFKLVFSLRIFPSNLLIWWRDRRGLAFLDRSD